MGFYSVKINGANTQQTLRAIQDIWDRIYPRDQFSYTFAEDTFNAQYNAERQFGRTITIFALIALVIACMGLFGLCSHSVAKRKKELGVRLVLGASFLNLSFILIRNYGKWIVIANIIAWPIAWMIINRWLENFACRISVPLWPFLVSGLVSLSIAFSTVSWIVFRAAAINLVEALRHE